MKGFNAVSFRKVKITDGFWKNKMELNENTTVYAVRDRFEDTGRFEAFKFNWTEGSDIPRPHIFWDSDVAKWMESVAFILEKKDVPELRAQVEELIALMERNQQEDGYFNIAHTVVHPELKFKIRDNHELYCLGHFIEAAVAWKNATGCDRLIAVVDKYVDLVIKTFVQEKTAEFTTPGHEEIELALIKLYRLTKNEKYLKLAMFFIDERGTKEEYVPDWCNPSYNQSHLPVREQKEAVGHSVRACYLYSAMADAVKETGDERLLEACKAIFDDIAAKKMYISGGIGSSRHGEAFTLAYDIPNDSAYSETCAAIALSMFADRMKDVELDSKYADVVERTIYNGILSGVSLDGKAFFYVNPLEINLSDRVRHISMTRADDSLPITRRQEVFSCSCCPPNITRFLSSIGDKIFSENDEAYAVHQYIPCEAEIGDAVLKLETAYPHNGKVKISVSGAKGKNLLLRIPGWCRDFSATQKYETVSGYAKISVLSDDFSVELDFVMKPVLYQASSAVRADAGKYAVMRGPVLYCFEEYDNPGIKHYSLRLDGNCFEADCEFDSFFDCNTLSIKAVCVKQSDNLYDAVGNQEEEAVRIRMIPYFGFANREESDMAVWINKY